MKISIIVEGATERVFLPFLRRYLENHYCGVTPRLDGVSFDGRIPTGDQLKHSVANLLQGKHPADHVIALTDVYTGTTPPFFKDADDAKAKMRLWVGPEKRFHPHAAQYEFEAWLLPYWSTIQKLARHNRGAPSGTPESVNHSNPPSHRIKEIYRIGSHGRCYIKARDAARILRDNDLAVAISQCPELKDFVNTILEVSGGNTVV